MDFFFPGLSLRVRPRHALPRGKSPAGDAQPCQARALSVTADLVDPRGRLRFRPAGGGILRQQIEKLLHSLHTKRGAESAGKDLPRGDERPHQFGRNFARAQIRLHGLLALGGGLLRPVVTRKVRTALAQPAAQLLHESGAFRAGQIHFVDKQERGHAVMLQQPPERPGVPLHSVRGIHQQHRAVEHGEGPFGFGGKIHVARRVQQRDLTAVPRQAGLFGKDRDAALPFPAVGVQEGVAVVHAPGFPQRPGQIQHGFAERGFPRVHMGQQPHAQPAPVFSHGRSLLSQKTERV